MYSIYKITSPSNRVYIGQSKNIESRKLNYTWTGKQTARQPLLNKSLVKYGFIHHKFEVIESNLSKEDANIREIFYIKIFKDLKTSLNCTDGGNNTSNIIKTPIIQFDLNGNHIQEFPSIIDAANSLNIIHQKISICLSKKRYYSSGFLWLSKKEYDKGILPIWDYKKSSRKRIIQQFSKENELIKEFNSAAEAAKELNISKNGILNCVSNFSKSAKGFIWKYKN
jgi:hypothetical protein